MTSTPRRRVAVARGPDEGCWWPQSIAPGALGGDVAVHHAFTAAWDVTPAARLQEETVAAIGSGPTAVAVSSPANFARWISQAGPLHTDLMATLQRVPVVSHRADAVDACASAGVPARLVRGESEEQLLFAAGASAVVVTARWAAWNDTAAPVADAAPWLVQPHRYRLPYELDGGMELLERVVADEIDVLVLTSPASVVGLFEIAADTGVSSALCDALSGRVMVAAADRPTAAVAEQQGAFVSRCPLRSDGTDLPALMSTAVHGPLAAVRVVAAAGAVEAGGERVQLSSLELRLFAALNRRQGLTCPRSVLAAEVWGDAACSPRLVSLASRLRQRIASLGLIVEGVQRRGYRLRSVDRQTSAVPSVR